MWNHWGPGGRFAYDGFCGFWPFHGGFGLIVTLIVIVGVILLIRYLWRGGSERAASDGAALSVLEGRYVNGEIDRETYIRMKKDLR